MDVTIELATTYRDLQCSYHYVVLKRATGYLMHVLSSIEVSDDDKTFTKVASEAYPEMKETDRNGLYEHKLTFESGKNPLCESDCNIGTLDSGMAWW